MQDFPDIIEFLAYEPDPKTDLEYNDDGSAYIPIWKVETWLDELTAGTWGRSNHKYSIHPGHSNEWLATSHELKLSYAGVDRILLCSSFIDPIQYPGARNLLQTGIAEATKAGVKILGSRFGKNLNDRTIIKAKTTKERIRKKPDATVMKAYMAAFGKQDMETMKRLVEVYDINTSEIHA